MTIDWRSEKELVPYPEAIARMEQRVAGISAGTAPEMIWLLEHPPLYTAGTSAKENDLLNPGSLPVYQTGRGGQYTYHGPGQRIAYVMLDLSRRGQDLRHFVFQLEEWIIRTLGRFSLTGLRRPGRVGVWIETSPGRDDKIAALGIRVRRWVTYHGIAINLAPRLDDYAGIVPCGIKPDSSGRYGVTSLRKLGLNIGMADLDHALKQEFSVIFGE